MTKRTLSFEEESKRRWEEANYCEKCDILGSCECKVESDEKKVVIRRCWWCYLPKTECECNKINKDKKDEKK